MDRLIGLDPLEGMLRRRTEPVGIAHECSSMVITTGTMLRALGSEPDTNVGVGVLGIPGGASAMGMLRWAFYRRIG